MLGDNKIEVFNCLECERPETHCEGCPIHEQPKLLETASFYLQLWNRVKTYSALPDIGGLLDQDAWTMKVLDRVGDLVRAQEELRRERQSN